MKIRAGFVSNSSSASYTVVLNETIESFLEVIMNDCQDSYMWTDYATKQIKNDLKFIDRKLKIASQYTGRPFFDSIKCLEKRRKDLQKKLKIVQDIRTKTREERRCPNASESRQLFDITSELSNVELEDRGSMVKLTSKTSMHNSYDDMPDLLREIVLFYTFERPRQIVASVEHHG